MVPIGRWVLGQACHQAQAWQEIGLAPIRIAVNISPVELRARDFLTGLGVILEETGLDPRLLELELTETFMVQDSAAMLAVLQDLKRLGIKLALDDFGTGYSSLNHLKRFPIDTLKIDQSFVRTVTTNAGDASIVCAVISMGKSLHMRVVAEGVETREQLAFLQERECPFGQGYYFSQPLTGPACTRLLRRGIAVDDREYQLC
jgi:EAL domain-containing protein (putative c-di-GMP-specific phosphodiesterase class I)